MGGIRDVPDRIAFAGIRWLAVLAAALACALAGCHARDQGREVAQEGRASGTAKRVADEATAVARSAAARSGHAAEDANLAVRVKSALLAEPALDALGIEVAAKDGTVTLSGRASSRDAKARATAIAARVPGVLRVVDDLAALAR